MDTTIHNKDESFSKALRHFDDARSLIQLAERVDDWDDNSVLALVRSASKEIEEASVWFYSQHDDDGQGGAA